MTTWYMVQNIVRAEDAKMTITLVTGDVIPINDPTLQINGVKPDGIIPMFKEMADAEAYRDAVCPAALVTLWYMEDGESRVR